MQIYQIILASIPLMINSVRGQMTITSCETLPSNYAESTPYSSSTTNILKNGVSMVGVFEYYKSVKYVNNCGETIPGPGIGTVAVF
ncbi:hypothetical protein TBLA_0C04230 [Henningerozyma blattae CBS 6284]|uniref:Uncharacterized protein n=1 Tax=Henningerozyma blattae (strain ATCC 34711 / CBS 6284 / DSM 70876 / NBRC 10599 / NRRL Y-10934 / UCD 77-7) TaxID=1071380 RepID=I2H1H1_HENB6|nr:hypothetical protein TBLA_0C04230 [Tetrapisispora blattae CBS 6284]CCH60223.1 hypothetical protein TBLA_0C04230 [Tetrapisispora blattae CBS 6284]